MIAESFTYGAGLHIWYSCQKKNQMQLLFNGWITRKNFMEIVVSLENESYRNYVKMIGELRSAT